MIKSPKRVMQVIAYSAHPTSLRSSLLSVIGNYLVWMLFWIRSILQYIYAASLVDGNAAIMVSISLSLYSRLGRSNVRVFQDRAFVLSCPSRDRVNFADAACIAIDQYLRDDDLVGTL